jgi:hypothetical protein
MRSAKWYAFRLSSKRPSTCEDLRRLKARRGCPPPRGATVKPIDSAALENLESMALTFLRETDAWETWKTNGAAAA